MNNKFQYFEIDLSINDKRDIRGLILDNGIKIVLIHDEDINTSCCAVGVNAGYLQDTFEGTAHFLEHLLFMGSTKYPEQNIYHAYIQNCGGSDNAFTSDNITCYYLELESNFMEKGIDMLSWFFREPLLDMKHINSEREIINAEHQKNILSDNWIMDDIFKKFMVKDSKFKKFGTGNNESLKNITKDDILKFYNKYYTTDNLYVCIQDSKNINYQIDNYVKYFNLIPTKKYMEKIDIDDRFILQNLKLKDENTIIFKSISTYNFLNYYLIFNCEEHNQIDYQLVQFIEYILGCEYEKSLCYFLKENDIAKSIHCSIDYFFDKEAIINIQIILINNQIDNFNITCQYLNKYLNIISKLTKDDFIQIYNNFQKSRLLMALYDCRSNSLDNSLDIITNLIKSKQNLNLCILRKYIIPPYSDIIYNKFIHMINTLIILLTTNINIDNSNNKFKKSKYYNTNYYLTQFNNISTNIDIQYDIFNILLFNNIQIKTDLILINFDKNTLPKLISKNNSREIYYLAYNKYNKPITNITVIRQNNQYINNNNKLILKIYINLCNKILNYYLDTIKDYKMNFIISIENEYIIYNYSGIDYVINKFINDITNKIGIYSLLCNENAEKYFHQIKRDMIDNINNLKFNSPYLLCIKYLSDILADNLMPDELIKLINTISYDSFKEQIQLLLNYEKEYFIIIGNLQSCSNNIFNNICYNMNIQSLIEIVDTLSLNNRLNLIKDSNKKISSIQSIEQTNDSIKNYNYLLTANQFNIKEVNNAVIDYFIVKTFIIEIMNDVIKLNQLKVIIKNKFIYEIISELLNEPLFNKIRTIDKLGYIVKCTFKYFIKNFIIKMFMCYIVQSSVSIDLIYKSINNFNEEFYNNFITNSDNIKENFNNLKKSKLFDLEKNPSSIEEEVNIYINTIINKYGIFAINKLSYEILENITFEEIKNNINDLFKNIMITNRFNIILDKSNNIE